MCLKSNIWEFISWLNIIILRFLINSVGDVFGFRLWYKIGICIIKCLVILIFIILFLCDFICCYVNKIYIIVNISWIFNSMNSIYLVIIFIYLLKKLF